MVLLMIVYIQLICSFSFAEEDQKLSVRKTVPMVSHAENILAVSAPEDGSITVSVRDEYHVYRVLKQEIPAGESLIVWDGCSYNSEKLNTKTYIFDCVLSGKSGHEYSYSFRSPVVNNAQHLQFALPSSGNVNLLSQDDWFLEAKTILDGKLKIEFRDQDSGETVFTVQKTMHKGRVEHFTFSQITGKTPPEPGHYDVIVYETSDPENFISFELLVIAGNNPVVEIPVTGDIMPPEDADDESLWKTMMEPGVVVDIDYLDHQNVYAGQDQKSEILGTLHGQTQCVSVFEINDEWANIGAWNHEDASQT